MRDIHVAQLDKPRPVVVLTREPARTAMRRVTVAPITNVRNVADIPNPTPGGLLLSS